MVESTQKPIKDQRICVIGAGPSGCSVLRAFKSAANKGDDIPTVVCYERQSEIGGQWIYNWRSSVDEHNNPVHSGMYRYLWSNAPKECLEFADYTFDEHFGKPIGSYPPREVLCDYINGRITKSGIKEWIHCNTSVHSVVWLEDIKQFQVTVREMTSEASVTDCDERIELYDYVLTCSGHFHQPMVPYWPGFESFHGRILHSHEFREAREFTSSRVLVIGSSYSAEDIASQVYKYGCKDITMCYRSKPLPYTWPAGFDTKPLLQSVNGKTCTFVDGTTKDVDAIILCTGYKHIFPFLEKSLCLVTKNRFWIEGCHKGIFWMKNPKMMFIGMQSQAYTFNMFDAQAWYARDVILGKLSVPAEAEQQADFDKWRTRELAINSFETTVRFQADYIKELIDSTDYPSFDIEQTVQEFISWNQRKTDSIMTFRDKPHTSAMTKKLSPVHHQLWLEALDDSRECYLGTGEFEKKQE